MQHEVLTRLFSSISHLEDRVAAAGKGLAQQPGIPEGVLQRVESYKGICAMQRRFACALRLHLKQKNQSEVSRHVTLINGLTAMIVDDLQLVLQSLKSNSSSVYAEAQH